MFTKIKEIINGHYNYLKDKLGTVEEHIKEQAEDRANKCPDCALAGKCKGCGCPTPQAFFSFYKTCPEQKWGPMKSKQEWANEDWDFDALYTIGADPIQKVYTDPKFLKESEQIKLINKQKAEAGLIQLPEPFIKTEALYDPNSPINPNLDYKIELPTKPKPMKNKNKNKTIPTNVTVLNDIKDSNVTVSTNLVNQENTTTNVATLPATSNTVQWMTLDQVQDKYDGQYEAVDPFDKSTENMTITYSKPLAVNLVNRNELNVSSDHINEQLERSGMYSDERLVEKLKNYTNILKKQSFS